MSKYIYCDMPWTGRIPTCEAGYLSCPDDCSCKGFIAKQNSKLTEADRIRKMSDKQLNELFHEIYEAGVDDTAANDWGASKDSFTWTCDWLEQEVSNESERGDS